MVHKMGEIRLSGTVSEAYRKSAEALKVIGGTIKSQDQATGKIKGTMSMSLWSWGEKILIDVSEADAGSLIRITSSSRLPTTLFDYGKNSRNVRRFLDCVGR